MVGQIPEGKQLEALKAALSTGEGAQASRSVDPTVYIYGPTKVQAAKTLDANLEGALLLFSTPMQRGEKLFLMTGKGQNPVAAEIVATRPVAAQRFEVEVAFDVLCPDFWRPLQKQ